MAVVPDEFIALANEMADAARDVILPYWRKKIEVQSKIETQRAILESPVTIADRKTELALREIIETRYPSHGISGEEYGDVRMDAKWIWVLDPIDGTKSFITGKPLFGTLIALLCDGVPVLGIIDQCVLGERWVGVMGKRTTLNGVPVHTAGAPSLKQSMVYATTPEMFKAGYERQRWDAICSAVLRALYGADCYAYALVASGFGADLVIEVVVGAGGVMTDWAGKPLTLQRKEETAGRVIAAATATLHAEALTILQAHPVGDDSRADSPSSQDALQSHLPMVGMLIGALAVLGAVTMQYKRSRD